MIYPRNLWRLLFLLPLLFSFRVDGGDGGGGGEGSGGEGGSGEGSGDGGGTTLLSGGANGGGGSEGEGGQGTPPAKEKPSRFGLGSIYSGEDGAIDPESLASLPEEYSDLKPLLGKYKTEKDFIQGIKNLQYLAGKKGLAPLPDDAPQAVKDEQAAILRSLNKVPETPDGYGVKKPDVLPEGVEWNDEEVNGYLAVMHKHNASPALVQELLAYDQERSGRGMAAGQQALEAEFAKEQEALKEVWGSKFEEKSALAVRGAAALGLDKNDPIFRNHKVAVAMARVAEMVSEDRLPGGGETMGGGDDRAKALDIINNPNNSLHKAYHDPEHPQHDEAVRTRSMLNARHLERQKR